MLDDREQIADASDAVVGRPGPLPVPFPEVDPPTPAEERAERLEQARVVSYGEHDRQVRTAAVKGEAAEPLEDAGDVPGRDAPAALVCFHKNNLACVYRETSRVW
jgi:hypothetical protein